MSENDSSTTQVAILGEEQLHELHARLCRVGAAIGRADAFMELLVASAKEDATHDGAADAIWHHCANDLNDCLEAVMALLREARGLA